MNEGNFYKPTFEDKPKDIEEYKERANPILQEHGQRIVKKSQYDLLKWSVITFGIAVLILGYAILNDSFKSTISCPTFSCPENVPCPSCPSCPENTCNFPNITNNCVFPSSLNINLSNHS